jgi:hypothetical protein
VTTSGGTPRPTPAEAHDARTQVDGPTVARPASHEAHHPPVDERSHPRPTGSPNGGSPPPSPPAERQTGAYDVAAALRAQATRAAQATRSAAQRVQDAMTPTPVDEERQGPAAGNGTPPASSGPTAAVGGAAASSGPPGRPAGPPSTAAPAQAYATGPGPATSARPASRPPDATAEVARPRTAPAPAPAPRRTGRVRKARLRLLRLDPWSVMKTAFLLSVAVGIMLFVAVAVLWSVLDAAGVFSAVGDVVRDITASETSPGVDIEGFVAMSRVLGFTTLVAVVDVVLVTALATLGAFLYNLSASLLGGLEVTLAEDD